MGYGDTRSGIPARPADSRGSLAKGQSLTVAGLAAWATSSLRDEQHARNRTWALLAKGLVSPNPPRSVAGAEGITTAEATYRAAQRAGVVMPITEQTHLVLSEGKPIRQAMRDLMQRERGDEVAGPLAEVSRLIASAAAARRDGSAARSPSSR